MTRACSLHEVPLGEGRNARVADKLVAIFNTTEGWFAVQSRCPHRGGPLADGIVGERSVTCPLHNFRFDLADGDAIGQTCPGLETWPVEIRGEEIFVDVPVAAAAAA